MTSKQTEFINLIAKIYDYYAQQADPVWKPSESMVYWRTRAESQFTEYVQWTIMESAFYSCEMILLPTRKEFRCLDQNTLKTTPFRKEELKLFDMLGLKLSARHMAETDQRVEDWIYDE